MFRLFPRYLSFKLLKSKQSSIIIIIKYLLPQQNNPTIVYVETCFKIIDHVFGTFTHFNCYIYMSSLWHGNDWGNVKRCFHPRPIIVGQKA